MGQAWPPGPAADFPGTLTSRLATVVVAVVVIAVVVVARRIWLSLSGSPTAARRGRPRWVRDEAGARHADGLQARARPVIFRMMERPRLFATENRRWAPNTKTGLGEAVSLAPTGELVEVSQVT